jgi:hypothetical protein
MRRSCLASPGVSSAAPVSTRSARVERSIGRPRPCAESADKGTYARQFVDDDRDNHAFGRDASFDQVLWRRCLGDAALETTAIRISAPFLESAQASRGSTIMIRQVLSSPPRRRGGDRGASLAARQEVWQKGRWGHLNEAAIRPAGSIPNQAISVRRTVCIALLTGA